MTLDGWKEIGFTYSSSSGIAVFRKALLLVLAHIIRVGSRYLKVYKSVNLMVIALKKSYIGLKTFPIDPTYEGKPEPKIIHLRTYKLITQKQLNKLERSKVLTSSSGEYVLNEWYQFTTVLKYSTYYGIKAKWSYPIGSKVRVQTKWRWPPGSSNPWYDGGYIEINVDSGVYSGWREGPYLRTLKFELKYKHSIVAIGGIAIEKVYALDTSTDPRATREASTYWDGRPVSGPKYYDIDQNTYRDIVISGGAGYDFRVYISLSYPWGVSISLGVDKRPSPYATLTIYAGTWQPGYVARIVSIGDSDFLNSRVFWYKP